MLLVTSMHYTIGTVVRCNNCTHSTETKPATSEEWHDIDGTVFYSGDSPQSLQYFLTRHGS